MQSPIWVLSGPFPHRGNAHPITCDRRKFRKVVIWVLVVVIAHCVESAHQTVITNLQIVAHYEELNPK
jgi:hypothetical protein